MPEIHSHGLYKCMCRSKSVLIYPKAKKMASNKLGQYPSLRVGYPVRETPLAIYPRDVSIHTIKHALRETDPLPLESCDYSIGLFISHTNCKPSRVSQGATTWITFVSCAKISARPPVAITFISFPSSCLKRATIPSTRPTYPNNNPDCIECIVLRPITDGGFWISTLGSLAVR